MWRWIHAARTHVIMMRHVLLLQTIETFSAHVLLGSLEDCVMKISTNVPRTILVEIREPVSTQKEAIHVNAGQDMKVEIAWSTPMIAPALPVKTEGHAWMAPEITNACVLMVLVARTVSMILTNVLLTLVKMGPPVMIMWTHTHVNARVDSPAPTVTPTIKIVQLAPAWMEEPVSMVSTATLAYVQEDFPDPIAKPSFLNATRNLVRMVGLAKMFQ